MPVDSRRKLIDFNLKYKRVVYGLVKDNLKSGITTDILDAGCGKGGDLEAISGMDRDISGVGIDVDPVSVEKARERLSGIAGVRVLEGSAEKLPFGDDSFDVVISSEMLEHLKDTSVFIKEVYRVLRRGGIFILTTPSKYNLTSLIGKLIPARYKKKLRKNIYYIDPGKDEDPHEREYTPGEVERMITAGGFSLEKITGGVIRVPVWTLFERYGFLIDIWKGLDAFLDVLPFGIHMKMNFVVSARKR